MIGLGADRIDFPEHFLADEFQLAPLRCGAVQHSTGLFGMASQASDLFVDIATVSEQRNFPNHIILADIDSGIADQSANTIQNLVAVFGNDLWCQYRDLFSFRLNHFALFLQVQPHRLALATSKVVEVIQ